MLSNLNFNDEYDTNNYSLKSFGIIWQILYSILYFSSLQLLNLVLLKHKPLGSVLMIANVAAILVFLAIGLYQISELRESYLDLESQNYYIRGAYYLYIRYIAALILAYALISQRFCLKAAYMQGFGRKGFELFMHLTILWFASSELLHHLSLNNAANSYKLALSILNGSYSLFLVSWGIAKNKSYVRISAMILFGLVLIKLFVYDLRHLDTISKTVVLMSLGIILLIISFLYNKYKSRISDDPET
jgi:uncharacterized membrane protein